MLAIGNSQLKSSHAFDLISHRFAVKFLPLLGYHRPWIAHLSHINWSIIQNPEIASA